MSERPWSYRVSIEVANQAGEVVGTIMLTGGERSGYQGVMQATGSCNFGANTGEETARFLDALADDLRGAHPERLDS